MPKMWCEAKKWKYERGYIIIIYYCPGVMGMDEDAEKIIKDAFLKKIASGELDEMNNKELKNIISDNLTETLVSQSEKDPKLKNKNERM
jgi:hypothetical protein